MASFQPLALTLVLLPTCLSAQEPSVDTAGFHAGQWGVQFGTNFNLANVGILKFTSPRSAWMLQLSGQHLTGTRTDESAGTTSDVADRSDGVSVGLGRRFFQGPRHKVRSFQSIGVLGSYADQKHTQLSTTYTVHFWTAGLLGELGAGYWVTPNLSLGATGSVFAGYTHSMQEGGNIKVEEKGWTAAGVTVLLAVGLYC